MADENLTRLETFRSFYDLFMRGSDETFVQDSNTIFNYDNISLDENNLPPMDKAIKTGDFLNPGSIKSPIYLTLPSDITKCISYDVTDGIFGSDCDFSIHITKNPNTGEKWIRIASLSLNNTNANSYYNNNTIYIKLRCAFNGVIRNIELLYTATMGGGQWYALDSNISTVQILGVNIYRVKYGTFDYLNMPNIIFRSSSIANITWLPIKGFQAESWCTISTNYCSNDYPNTSGGGGGMPDIPSTPTFNALVVQNNWYDMTQVRQDLLTNVISYGVIYNGMVRTPNGISYIIETTENALPSAGNKYYSFRCSIPNDQSTNKIAVGQILSGPYDYIKLINGAILDINGNTVG